MAIDQNNTTGQNGMGNGSSGDSRIGQGVARVDECMEFLPSPRGASPRGAHPSRGG